MGKRMSILNAYDLPDRDYPALYDTMLPVNALRVVFNDISGTSCQLLDDTSFYCRPGSLFIMTDVTERVSGNKWDGASLAGACRRPMWSSELR